MLFVSILFATLLLPTPPLILGGWVILLIRFGLLRSLSKQIKIVADHQKEPSTRNRVWTILTVGMFSGFVILFLVLVPLFGETISELEANIWDKEEHTSIILSFLYSPVMPILVLEAWLGLVSYFGFYYGLRRFNFSSHQGEWLGNVAITTIQFIGILSSLIGFRWWSHIVITDQDSSSLSNFSLIELSPTTVLLTFGLVIMLFMSLSKLSILEENVEQSEQIAGRMTAILLTTLVILSVIGGLLSILIHLDRGPL